MTLTAVSRPETRKVVTDPTLPATPEQGKRDEALSLHNHFRRISSLANCRNCFHSPRRGSSNDISLFRTLYGNGVTRGSIGGLQSCKTDICPRCGFKKERDYLRKMLIAAPEHIAQGGEAIFFTLTLPAKVARTPRFLNADYEFRKTERFNELNLGELSPKARKKVMEEEVAAYAAEHNMVDSHEDWELNKQWNAMTKAYAKLFDGGTWQREKKKNEVSGRFARIEISPTPEILPNGVRNWNRVAHNLHLHGVLFLDRRLNDREMEAFMSALKGRWVKALKEEGYNASPRAQDFTFIASNDLSKVLTYLLKEAHELIFGKNINPDRPSNAVTKWDALRDSQGGRFSDTGELLPANMSALGWWRHYEQVQRNRRVFLISLNFFKKLGVEEKIKAIDEERRSKATRDLVLSFSQGQWTLLRRNSPEAKWQLLNLVENAANEEVYALLDQWIVNGEPIVYKKPTPTALDDIADEEWDDDDIRAAAEVPF